MTNQTADLPGRWTRDYAFDVLKALEIGYVFGVPGTDEIPIIDGTSYPENGSSTSGAYTRTSPSARPWDMLTRRACLGCWSCTLPLGSRIASATFSTLGGLCGRS